MISSIDEEVPWRLAEEQFLSKFDEFIEEKYINIISDIDRFKGDNLKEINIIINKIKYNSDIDYLRQLKAELISKDVSYFSEIPDSIEDVVFKTIIDNKYRTNGICQSYICESVNLTEKAIEDLMFINSNLFEFSYWDDIHVKAITDILSKGSKYDCIDDFISILNNDTYHEDLKNKIRTIFNISNKKIEERLNNSSSSFNYYKTMENRLKKLIEVKKSEQRIVEKFVPTIKENQPINYYIYKMNDLIDVLEEEVPEYDAIFYSEKLNNMKFITRNHSNRSESSLIKSLFNQFIKLNDSLSKEIYKAEEKYKTVCLSMKKTSKTLEQRKQKMKDSVKYTLNDRLDWVAIYKYQTISEEFENKYKLLLGISENDGVD